LTRAGEEGCLGFESGTLRFARLGPVRGVKAIARMFRWQEGSFEFHTYLDETEEPDPPSLVYGVLMEAAQQHDEWNRADRSALPAGALLAACAREGAEPAGKVEAAILDLLAAGEAPLEAVLDTLPDFDAEIVTALVGLLEAGRVRIRG
jgi:hypothetical protein